MSSILKYNNLSVDLDKIGAEELREAYRILFKFNNEKHEYILKLKRYIGTLEIKLGRRE